MEIHEYYCTFGVQYTAENNYHPLGMHKDGYAVIEAPSLETARRIAHAVFGDNYAFIYDAEHFVDDGTKAKWHHAGELMRVCWKVPLSGTGGIVPEYITDKIPGHEGDQP